MSLTVGSALQDGRYVIQAVLDVSEVGITYQASHTYLDQTVIIQTLNERSPDANRGVHLRQQFLTGVRRIVRGQYPYPGRVLDYFTEADMPFLVLERVAGQAPPSMNDWLPPLEVNDQVLATSSLDAALNAEQAPDQPSLVSLTDPLDRAGNAAPAIAPPAMHQNGSSKSVPLQNTNAEMDKPDTVKTIPWVAEGQGQPISKQTVKQTVHSPKPLRSKTHPLLPLALVMTSVIAGLLGAGFGWTVRLKASGHLGGNNGSLFGQEQAFPPKDNWPIQEATELPPAETTWESSDEVPFAPVRREDPAPLDPAPENFVPPDKTSRPSNTPPKFPAPSEALEPLAPDLVPIPEPSPESPPTSPVELNPVPVPGDPPQSSNPAPGAEPIVPSPNSSSMQSPVPVVQ